MGMARTQELIQQLAFEEERYTGLGGSDTGALYNIGFGCRRALWYVKRRTKPDFPKMETPEFERGHLIEPVIKKLYEMKSGRELYGGPIPMLRHKEYPFLINHMDGRQFPITGKQGDGVLECKCINRFILKKFKKEGLREEYSLQLQQAMAVSELQWGTFAVLCLDPWEFHWFDVARDEELIAKIIEDADIFWASVENGPIPDPLPEIKDKRCATCQWRKTCRGSEMAQGLIPDSESQLEGVIDRPDLLPLVAEIQELAEMKDEASELWEEARNLLKKQFGDAEIFKLPGYRAFYSKSYPERLDQAAVKTLEKNAKAFLDAGTFFIDYAELEEQYKKLLPLIEALTKLRKKTPKDNPERTLRIYPTGD